MSFRTIDCHTHTTFSPDGKSTPEQMCDRAAELNLSAYAITDHCECSTWFEEEYYDKLGVRKSEDPFVVYDYKSRFYNAVDTIEKLKEQYQGRLNLICGIELGQPTQGWEAADEVAKNENLDYIIGSIHQIKGHDDFAFLEYKNFTEVEIKSLLEAYYSEMFEMVKWGKFDILGHLTYPLRYIQGEQGVKVDNHAFDDIIREIFKTLAQNGKGIEINTSGLRQKYGRTFPELDYVKMFKDVGGEILSIGSDAHRTNDLASGVQKGSEIALRAGFKHLSYFKNRKPEFVAIEG